MAEERVQRRLAAILAADVVGYSRLMERDEAGTLAALKSRRRNILDPLVAKHQGRIFKTTGDGVLVEFGSAVNAVQCAIDLQAGMVTASDDQPDDRHIVLRIGVNLGDVMVEGSDLYGDGVNIAARLEGIAEPGGVLLSGTAYEYVRNKVNAGFEDLGFQTLKNIAEPVRAYRVAGTPSVSPGVAKPARDRPSIAVLPFTNMSDDPKQQYLSDGLTEDIITELSRFQSIFVIARNSSFQFRDKAIDIRRVGRELGVQFVLEGSIRRAGDNLRITAQLIDAATGNHSWSERYERRSVEIFAIQDELIRTIVAQLEGRVSTHVAQKARRMRADDMAAYDYVLQARRNIDSYDTASAAPLLRRAIEIDSGFAQAYAWLAFVFLIDCWSDSRPELLDEGLTAARKAIALDPTDAFSYSALGQIQVFRREFDEAGIACDRALALNPSDTFVIADRAHWLIRVGRHAEGLASLDTVLQRDPFPPSWYWDCVSIGLIATRRYAEAIEAIRKWDQLHFWHYAYLAACYAHLGRMEESRVAEAEVLRLNPEFTIRFQMLREPFKHEADAEPLLEGMRKAGLPE